MALQNYPLQIISGQIMNFVGDHVSGTLPGTNSLTIPVSINVFGALANLMGKPDGFINIQVSGLMYKIPYYK